MALNDVGHKIPQCCYIVIKTVGTKGRCSAKILKIKKKNNNFKLKNKKAKIKVAKLKKMHFEYKKKQPREI